MKHAKVEVEDFRVCITRGTETIAIDEGDDGAYHLWVTRPNGAWSVAVFKFEEDRVDIVELTPLAC